MTQYGITKQVFGENLETIMSYQKEKCPTLDIPLVLLMMRDSFVLLEGYAQEGIFRVPGKQGEIDGYKELLNIGKYEIWENCDAHTIAGLFKLFLRELAEPVVPSKLYFEFVDRDMIDELENDEKAQEIMDNLLNKLPETNRNVFIFLIDFLQLLSKHEEKTKMGIDNLAMVFSAAMLISTEVDAFSALTYSNSAKDLIANFIMKLPNERFNKLNLKVEGYEEGSGMKMIAMNPIELLQQQKQKELEEKEKSVKQKSFRFSLFGSSKKSKAQTEMKKSEKKSKWGRNSVQNISSPDPLMEIKRTPSPTLSSTMTQETNGLRVSCIGEDIISQKQKPENSMKKWELFRSKSMEPLVIPQPEKKNEIKVVKVSKEEREEEKKEDVNENLIEEVNDIQVEEEKKEEDNQQEVQEEEIEKKDEVQEQTGEEVQETKVPEEEEMEKKEETGENEMKEEEIEQPTIEEEIKEDN